MRAERMKMIKLIKNFLNISMATSLAFVALGLCFVIAPATSFDVIAKIVAVLLIVFGVFGLFSAFSSNMLTFSLSICLSVLAIVGGIAIFGNPGIVKTMVPVALGIYFIVSGLIKIRYSYALRSTSASSAWAMPFCAAVLSVVCGIIMLVAPFAFADAMIVVAGIVMIVYALSDFANAVLLRRDINALSDFFEEQKTRMRGGAAKNTGAKKNTNNVKVIKEAEIVKKDEKDKKAE